MPNLTTDELFSQILSAMNTQTEMLTKNLTTLVHDEINAAETRINLKIENEVSKRIDALFDGYKLCHEQQWELDRRVRAIEEKLGMAI